VLTSQLISLKKNLPEKNCSTKSETHDLTQCYSCTDSDAECKLLSTVDNFEFGDEITHRLSVITDPSTLTTIVVQCEIFID
jgi:hypothetical protein